MNVRRSKEPTSEEKALDDKLAALLVGEGITYLVLTRKQGESSPAMGRYTLFSNLEEVGQAIVYMLNFMEGALSTDEFVEMAGLASKRALKRIAEEGRLATDLDIGKAN
jgi:hypothetical protein